MPTWVEPIEWHCQREGCETVMWLKPSIARRRKYCSRACTNAAMRVEKPVRAKQSNSVRYTTEKVCEYEPCGKVFQAKRPHFRFCSRICGARHTALRRRTDPNDIGPRPCEYCGEEFTPRRGSAGRFCCWDHKNLGLRGEKAAHYRGGRYTTSEGYVRVLRPDHPKAYGHGGYVAEHRVVMEEMLGRYLEPGETVHHINLQNDDNRPENLQLRKGNHGRGAVHRCLDCGSTNIGTEPIADDPGGS